ncbi:uncharacterized protein VTP21DRAFT_10281 [Calcarisporiella thermophila]|uniref:uncharacterized protein n=1 Tax=Calcarisporiella thermophila TaxID=911321 RepID=UPI0037449744
MSVEQVKSFVDVSAKGAEQFVELYYRLYDNQRGLVNKFYRDDSAILWNGNAYSGVTPFSDFLVKLPSTSHEVNTFDCHPIISSINAQGTSSIVVIVNGSVKYGDEQRPRLFSQTFILSPIPEKPGNYYVSSDCFRFV